MGRGGRGWVGVGAGVLGGLDISVGAALRRWSGFQYILIIASSRSSIILEIRNIMIFKTKTC